MSFPEPGTVEIRNGRPAYYLGGGQWLLNVGEVNPNGRRELWMLIEWVPLGTVVCLRSDLTASPVYLTIDSEHLDLDTGETYRYGTGLIASSLGEVEGFVVWCSQNEGDMTWPLYDRIVALNDERVAKVATLAAGGGA